MSTDKKPKNQPMILTGDMRPASIDLDARTVEVVFTTGEAGRRYDWHNDTDYLEELEITPNAVRTARLDKGLSVIDSHKRYEGIDSVFGITTEYRFEDGSIVGKLRFATDEDSEKRFKKVADGILRHVSLSYRVHKFLKEQGDSDKIPTYRAIDWEPLELSFTPVSFETSNGVRSDSGDDFNFELIEDREMEDENGEQTPAPAVETEAARSAPVAAAPAAAAPVAAAPVAAPETNVRELLNPMLEAARSVGVDDQFAIDAFGRGDDMATFNTALVTKLAVRSEHNPTSPVLGSDERLDASETKRQDAENAIMLRAGLAVDGDMSEQSRHFSTMTLFETAREFVEQNGMGESREKIAQRAMNSTSDFPLILENVMHKTLLTGYQETPQTWRDLGRKTTVTDFRDKHMYRMGDAPNLLPLGEHGEYKSATLSETKESYAIDTFARKISFTRKMLINDDMGAIITLPRTFGQSGSRLESDLVWGMLLNYDFRTNKALGIKMADGKPVFDDSRGNRMTGVGSIISKATLQAHRKAGRKIKTIDGNLMNLTFSQLAVSEDTEQEAEDLLFPRFMPTEIQNQAPRVKMGLIVEPRIGIAGYDNGNLVFSNMADTFEYANLAGEADMVSEFVNQMDADGVTLKVRKDFGCGIVDWRGMRLATGKA